MRLRYAGSAMKTVVLVRHGATNWNESGYCQGRKDVPLSALGRAQAKALATPLAEFEFDAVFASPLIRAIETGRIAGYDPAIVEDLVEIDRGHWEGHAMEEVRRRWGKLHGAWYADPSGLSLPGGEAFDAFWERAGRVLAWVESLAAETVLLCGHKATNRAVLARAEGRKPAEVWGIRQPQASVSVLVREPEGWRVERAGDDSHLAPEQRSDS